MVRSLANPRTHTLARTTQNVRFRSHRDLLRLPGAWLCLLPFSPPSIQVGMVRDLFFLYFPKHARTIEPQNASHTNPHSRRDTPTTMIAQNARSELFALCVTHPRTHERKQKSRCDETINNSRTQKSHTPETIDRSCHTPGNDDRSETKEWRRFPSYHTHFSFYFAVVVVVVFVFLFFCRSFLLELVQKTKNQSMINPTINPRSFREECSP